MVIEPRKPPADFGLRLWRALGGRAGWKALAAQLAFVALIVWLGFEVYSNAQSNIKSQTGFSFLFEKSGIPISQTLIPYEPNEDSDTYGRAFLVGLVNTLLVSVVGIFFATVLGFTIGLARLSTNWLVSRVAGAYVELVRNLPLLFQIVFWYFGVLATLPPPRRGYSLLDTFFLNNRGLIIPKPVGEPGLEPFLLALLVAIVGSIALNVYARRLLFATGRRLKIWPIVVGMLVGLPIVAALIFGRPVHFEVPALDGLNFVGGMTTRPEFVALTLALSTYTAAFIGEIVRAGIQSVHKGQMEAGASLGLSRGATLRLIVVPLALRVILPPLTNQYLNLTKNSSLAITVGYPDLVSVFANTSLTQTGQAIEIIGMTMAVYLAISLLTSVIMNFYNWRINRSAAR